MKLTTDFSALWNSVQQMGKHEVRFDLEQESASLFEVDADLSTIKGRDLVLEELVLDYGVLSYRGRQVLLFIPDQGLNVLDVIAGSRDGRRFHVADCRTLNEMRKRSRFNRYKATYNTSGKFMVFGLDPSSRASVEGEAELKVCKNCLSYLNYKGYKSRGGSIAENVFKNFSIAEFLSEYSTLFTSMPDRAAFIDQGGYVDDWKKVSINYRRTVNYCCESCHVDLTAHRRLLHTHHVNGNKRENQPANLKALCIDCHCKQPLHEHMRVSHDDMQLLTQLRKEQLLLNTDSWQQVRSMADQALDGLLLHYEKSSMELPEVDYELLGQNGSTIAKLELAWPNRRIGIAIGSADLQEAKKSGWSMRTIGQALKDMNQ